MNTENMHTAKEKRLKELFASWVGSESESFDLLPKSGSNRKYYRISGGGRSAIGVVGENDRENAAFVSFSRALREAGVNVPEVYADDLKEGVYLQQDLGSLSLYDYIISERGKNGGKFPTSVKTIYKKVLAQLYDIQHKGWKVINFKMCYPRVAFDKQSMQWDIQYFKYYFLRLAGIAYDEDKLEADFAKLISYLSEANSKYFLYRDFQSRNIMLDEELNPWFIDFQGGRQGARQYDVASLLYDAKADIPSSVRNELLTSYVMHLKQNEVESFSRYYYGFCLMRIMQAMGAYGFRGYFERKEHFLKSIPFAQDNLREIVGKNFPNIGADYLKKVLTEVAESSTLRSLGCERKRLCVHVGSFSYKHGIPVDTSGNGGGHVFDCRALPNPGRYEEYKHSTGRDSDVRSFFAEHSQEMSAFLDGVKAIVGMSVDNYIERGFANLMVSFGCTGGQHRSVYCAEMTANWLSEKYPEIEVELFHHEQTQLNKK